jgi:Zn-dependent membrane protease YugP
MPIYGFNDPTIILVIIGAVIAIAAQMNVKGTFSKFSKKMSRRNLTGAEVAREILAQNGLNDIPVERVEGELTDHYDPKARVIRLSSVVYDSTSVASIGVAAHETGHAIQHSTKYTALNFRNAIIPISSLGSNLAVPLIIAGFIFGIYGLILLGIFAFSLAVLFQLITLPVEFNASKRAIDTLGNISILDENELNDTKKVLRAAAMTYVAALAVSLLSLLRFVLLANRRR